MRKLNEIVPLAANRRGRKTNGRHETEVRMAPEVAKAAPDVAVPDDGKKRVLIEIGEDGNFAPIRWWNMRVVGPDQGMHEATVIVAHAGFMLAERSYGFFHGVLQEAIDDAAEREGAYDGAH
jgi:hypothetical protein